MIANNKGFRGGRLWLAIRDIPFGNIGKNRWFSRWVFQSRFIYSDGLFPVLSCIAHDAALCKPIFLSFRADLRGAAEGSVI
jgi:hypothetical protein